MMCNVVKGDVNFDDFYERSRPIYFFVFFGSVSFSTLNFYRFDRVVNCCVNEENDV